MARDVWNDQKLEEIYWTPLHFLERNVLTNVSGYASYII